jgi:phytoene dehydrogenase-like protein
MKMLYSVKDKITKNYDVIVVGAGLAGMTLANKLALNGRKVLILEAHNKLGGLATWFKRAEGEHIFDVSLHGFPVGMIKTCRKYWSKEIADHIHQLKSVRFINPQFEIETDFTKVDFIKILIQKFEIQPEVVQAFFNELSEMNFYDQNQMKNRELFEKYFPGRNDVMRFLLEPIVYANGSNLEDPAISYGIVFSNFMNKGVYIFQGGTDKMISMMKDELIKNGVDIRLQSKVDKILIEKKKVMGVSVKDENIFSNAVVMNGNIKIAIDKLIGHEHFSQDFLNQFYTVKLNTSSCQVYMGIKKGESIPFIGDLIFTSSDSEFNTELVLSNKIGSQTFSVYYPEMRPHLDARYAIVSSSNAIYSDWSKLSKSEYEEQKEYLINRALLGIEKIVPGIKEKIDYIEAATPLTVERYTHHENGSSFGTKFEGLQTSLNLPNELSGMFHAGSVGIIMSGWLGAANYGVIVAHNVDTYLSNLEKNEEKNE